MTPFFYTKASSRTVSKLKTTSQQSLLSVLLCMTPLQYLPVRVRRGLAKGAWWTFLPHSHYWRFGGESEIVAAMEMLGNVNSTSCWDFGAHFGIHTVGLAMRVGNDGQVAAFEPNPFPFSRLERHVRMNRFTNVRLFKLGVSDQISRVDLIIADGKGSLLSHFQREDETVDVNTPRVPVSTVCTDLLVEKGEIRLPDFIKVDVQGHGANALKGSIVSIEKKLPMILFSNHSELELDGTRRLLGPLGYNVFDTRGNQIGWEYFKSPWHQTAILKVLRK
jgi:FkbM family methyltransferase